jgi:asparagine synthase (glutamine-hydrolysing)
MCGINVIYDPERSLSAPEALVARMNGEMVYRGPDGEGTFADGPVVLGMRRLSIIDLSGGQQPLFNEDHSLALVCNGEIYNHVELRAALVARGHRFATASDCETILHLYEEHGEACVEQLRGMFAFALWDARRGRLVAARDRLGIKPLYLARRGRRVALSSELKTLVKAGLGSAALDHEALYQTMRHTYPIDERRTLAAEVDRVPPGTLLVCDEGGVRERRYWTPSWSGGADAPDAELAETLAEAVRLHLRSDVPVAVLLSAGMDSAGIAAIAAKAEGEVVALSAGYAGQHDCDERAGAQQTARAIGMRCVEVELDQAEFPTLFDELSRRCDEPPCDIASMAQWALYRACRAAGYKVVLSGIGGDEIFFGYPTWNHVGELLARRARVERHLPPVLVRAAERAGAAAPGLRDRLGPAWPGPFTGLRRGVSVANERALRLLGADPGGRSAAAADRQILALEARAARGPDAVYAYLAGAYLPNNGFLLADKLGMGNSVEVRVPLADHVLFERVTALPLGRRFSPRESKPLLKALLRAHVPAEVLARPKQGFTPPPTFVREIVARHADALLDSPDLRGWLRHDRLAELVRGYLAGDTGPQGGAAHRLLQRGRALAFGGLSATGAGWALYSLVAFVKSREGWR